jgi:hypothetical protein
VPFRRTFLAVEALVALGALAGVGQLLSGTATPPVSDLAPLGLSTWRLPALWLFASVVVPSAVAAWLAWRRSARTPAAVLVACAALAVELLVQIPFLGFSALQAVMATVAVVLAALALRDLRHSRPSGGPADAGYDDKGVTR